MGWSKNWLKKCRQENAENSSESAPGSPLLLYPAFKNSFGPRRHCPRRDEAYSYKYERVGQTLAPKFQTWSPTKMISNELGLFTFWTGKHSRLL